MIQLISDLHLECYNICENNFNKIFQNMIIPSSKILCIGGDVCNPYSDAYRLLLLYVHDKYDLVIIVTGNHEYYNNDIDATDKYIMKLTNKYNNIKFLNNKMIEYDGYIFIGSVLWSKLHKKNFSKMNKILFNSCRIKSNNKIIGVEGINKLHEACVKFISDTLNNNLDKNVIIITHYMPSYSLVTDKYKNNENNDAFVTDLDYLFINYPNIKLWLFGHTHDNIKKYINSTLCVCNPRGYYKMVSNKYENNNYKNNMIIKKID